MTSVAKLPALIFRHPRSRRHRLCGSLLSDLQSRYSGPIIESDYPGFVREKAASSLAGFEGIVVTAGGDGTLHEAVNGWADIGFPSGIRFAPLPLGTGNDFLYSLDRRYQSIESFLNYPLTRTLEVDLGRVSYQTPEGRQSRFFCVGATCGLSASVTKLRAEVQKILPGPLSYLLALGVSFLGWRNCAVKLITSNEVFTSETMINFNAANVKHYGGGMVSAPQADPLCGGIDTVSVNLTLWEALLAMPENFRGDFDRIPKVEQRRLFDPFQVECSPRSLVQADGELLGLTPMEIEVWPGKLPILLPALPTPNFPVKVLSG